MIKAVIFDIDDTLIATSRANAHCRKVARDLLEKKLETAERLEIDRVEARLYRIFGWARMQDMWSAISRELTGSPLDDDTLVRIENRFADDFVSQIAPLDGVVQTLETIRSRGYDMGIISDGDRKWQHTKLHQSGLVEFFQEEHIHISIQSDLRSCKPSWRNFRAHEKKFGLKERQLLYIGDKPWDIIAANNSGWVSVLTTQAWADRDNRWPDPEIDLEKPDYRVDSFAKLLEVLENE